MAAMDDYSRALDYLRILARQEFAGWWAMEGAGVISDKALHERFAAVVANYGEHAAYETVDYLVMSRSLDDDLRGLPLPEVSAPVGSDQSESSLKWALAKYVEKSDPTQRQMALDRANGVLDRLVTLPARETIVKNVLRDGTAYARVPEPGACGFCLMLASRGAVYTRETVGHSNKYHDRCRCLGIEVKRDGSNLPRINQELHDVSKVLAREFGRPANAVDWRQYVEASRQQMAGQEWPRLRYVRTPRYSTRDVLSPVFEGEKLPPLDKMPGHVLHGWRDDDRGKPHTEHLNLGHRWDSQRAGASKFPGDWTDQKIVDAVRDALENPDYYSAKPVKRIVWKEVDGLIIQARYNVRPDGILTFDTAFPEKEIPKEAKRNAK